MKRTFLTALSTAAIALAVPSVAAAAHHSSSSHRKAHHARRHARHKAAAVSTASAPASASGTAGFSTSQGTTPAPAGTLTSFTGGVLTIMLTAGGTLSGQVTQGTHIECVPATPPASTDGDQDDQPQQGSAGASSSQYDAVHALGTSTRPGDEQGQGGQGGHDGQGEGTPCTTAALTAGAVVRVAELTLTGAGAVWDRIEIVQ